jgi:hypothetical protein
MRRDQTPFLKREWGFAFGEGDMRSRYGVTLVVIGIIISLFPLEAWGADWKYFGGSMLRKGEAAIVYYDPESLAYLSNGNARVWTKAVSPSERNKKIMEKEEVIEKAARKIAKGYYPPYVLAHPYPETTYDNYIDIIVWEEGANDVEIKPRGSVLYEVNCRDKMIRTLQTTVYDDAGVLSGAKGGEWDYIGPETNAETLRKILCKDRK